MKYRCEGCGETYEFNQEEYEEALYLRKCEHCLHDGVQLPCPGCGGLSGSRVRGEIYGRWEERKARGNVEVFEGVQDGATAEHVATFKRKVEARPGFVRWLRPVLLSAAPRSNQK